MTRRGGVDFDDPKARRQLCTGLMEIIYAQGPEGASIVDLAEHTPTLTAAEVAVIRAYFQPADNDEPTSGDDRTTPGGCDTP